MKGLFEGFCTAFSLYSRIPVPRAKWDRDSMRYALCFFPLVGVVIAALLLLWYALCSRFFIAPGLFAAVAALLPLAVTGGIHMDGFIDTMDALSSHGVVERRLEILKDPHVGAFGVIACAGYLLLQFGMWQQVYRAPVLVALPAVGCVLSRALNGLSIATFRCARDSGLVHAFSSSAARTAAVVACVLFILASCAVSIVVSPLWGSVMIAAALAYFLYHRRFCLWEFDGNTGDLAGFLLQNVELISLAAAVVGGVWR